MQHLGTQTIETPRLILRRFTLDDAEAMFRNWAGDPDVTQYLMWSPHPDIDESRRILSEWDAEYGKDDYYLWAIVPKDFGEPIGGISVVEQDDHIRMVHIGYCIGQAWWHQGYTSEALAALIQFFFKQVGVNRIESRHDPRNPNSGKVMLKCGLRYEGTHYQADWNNQGICDAAVYALLAEHYFQK